MKAEELEKEFSALSDEEQMNVLRKILPGFCRTMAGDPKKARELLSVLSEECGGAMANMSSMMGMMGRKGGGCCG